MTFETQTIYRIHICMKKKVETRVKPGWDSGERLPMEGITPIIPGSLCRELDQYKNAKQHQEIPFKLKILKIMKIDDHKYLLHIFMQIKKNKHASID